MMTDRSLHSAPTALLQPQTQQFHPSNLFYIAKHSATKPHCFLKYSVPLINKREFLHASDLGVPAMGEKLKVVVTRRLIAEAQHLLDTVPDLDLVQWPSEQV
jgi:hypothetical protein